MSAEKPSIIAGNEGYIGLFDEDKLSISLKTNFCCRGEKMSDAAVLTQDIANFFGLWDEEKKRIGKYGRETVLMNYSVTKMADDAEKVYKEAMEEM